MATREEEIYLIAPNPYIRFFEYFCVIDLTLKIITLFHPVHAYLRTNQDFRSQNCYQVYSLEKILVLGVKLYSIVVLGIGVKAAWFKSYSQIQLLQRHIRYYVLMEIGLLTLMLGQISYSGCSDVSRQSMMLFVWSALISGTCLIALYYYGWMFIIEKVLHLLRIDQLSANSLNDSNVPRSFREYKDGQKQY